MTFDEMLRKVLEVLPNATAEEDNDGQIVLYTNLCMSAYGDSDGDLVAFTTRSVCGDPIQKDEDGYWIDRNGADYCSPENPEEVHLP